MASIVKKLLIANRGEIALRVVRTAKEMGISTVAVYSEQDRNSRYVDMADEAYLLSGDTYKDTYLNEDLLIDILHKTGANAVHPGYGFLSEVPSFAQKVEDAGAIWVGPHHTALVDLGDKITARRVALRAKVPPVPGLSEPVTDVRTLLDFAHTHGYPIMMKRTDGGGGHGITVVHDDEELRRFYMNHDALQGGDLKEYFIEKFVDKARHVETQSGRDSHGNFTVYSTRDCSLQRRNQKLVEEAPAPFLSEEIISTLEEYSRRLFTTVGYVGLGTCEFMVTPNGKVYFLEVNPRLQVEHTVSEEVSGLDLVREQLNIAAGGELTRAPELRGHSFELRITSEDPATNLTPGSGTLEKISITKNTQPCLFCVDLAAAEALREAGITPDMTAGFSLGEVAAVTFAGIFTTEEGFSLVTKRGEAMQASVEQAVSAMAAVLKLPNEKVEELCRMHQSVFPVNYNCPGQLVVAGLKTTLPDFLSDVAANGGRAVPLNVSGGFHSPFMESASARLHDVLETMDVKEPTVPVYANYTAEPYTKETAKELLTQQVAHPVRWQQTVEKMIEAGVDTFVEVGAGKTLCGLIKKTSRAVKVYNVEDAETLSAAVQAIRAEGENA